ncbi:hypothetical protein MUO98_01745 [Candidatus Bathyarchaeota archaeon]|nr:hypothetical protein [Candidatus Bathyarchaeota archaeon]
MKLQKVCIMALCTLLLTLASFGLGHSAPDETPSVYYLEYGGLKIDVRAPSQSYPGENITVTVKAEAITEIYVKYVRVTIYGALNATDKVTLRDIIHLENYSFTSSFEIHEVQYNVSIPDNMSPGLTYGVISCEWELMGSPQKILPAGFVLTYIRNMDLEQLQTEYQELNDTHQSLLQNYTELESGINEDLDSTRNMLYIFVATTVVASITVIVLLMRKPKKIWI